MTCATPDKILFNGLENASRETWMKALQSQPAAG